MVPSQQLFRPRSTYAQSPTTKKLQPHPTPGEHFDSQIQFKRERREGGEGRRGGVVEVGDGVGFGGGWWVGLGGEEKERERDRKGRTSSQTMCLSLDSEW